MKMCIFAASNEEYEVESVYMASLAGDGDVTLCRRCVLLLGISAALAGAGAGEHAAVPMEHGLFP